MRSCNKFANTINSKILKCAWQIRCILTFNYWKSELVNFIVTRASREQICEKSSDYVILLPHNEIRSIMKRTTMTDFFPRRQDFLFFSFLIQWIKLYDNITTSSLVSRRHRRPSRRGWWRKKYKCSSSWKIYKI